MKKSARALAVLLAVILLASGCGGSTKDVNLAGSVVKPPFTVAADQLETEDGQPYSFTKDTTKPLTLVFYGYTHCPDICFAVLTSIASGLAKLSDEDRAKVDVVFVTSDPNRDTGPVLHDYLQRFDPSFRGLTGSITTIAKVALSMGVGVDTGEQLASGGYDPNSHQSYVIGIDQTHTAPIFWDGETAPSEFAHDIAFLLEEGTKNLEPAVPSVG